MSAVPASKQNIVWLPINHSAFRVSGFIEAEASYTDSDDGGIMLSRIPKDKRQLIGQINPCLTQLGANTSGGQLAFCSDTEKVYIKVKLSDIHNMVNMTATGESGFDCYVGPDRNSLKFVGVSKFNIEEGEYTAELASYPRDGKMHEILINFPLYNGFEQLMIGVERGAVVERPAPFEGKGKLVFYGTSITQGGCASRPGMAYVNIIGRKLNMEVCNFGFSGNGLGEYEVADMLAEIENPAMYVLDYEANSGTNGRMVASLRGFIERLRKKHPKAPILVLSRIPYVMDELIPELGRQRKELRDFQRTVVEEFKSNGDMNIYFYDGAKLWDSDYDEYTVDTIHPTDLGFYLMAKRLIPVICGIYKK